MKAASYFCDQMCSKAFFDGLSAKDALCMVCSDQAVLHTKLHGLLHMTYELNEPVRYQTAGISTLSIASLAAPSFSKCTNP